MRRRIFPLPLFAAALVIGGAGDLHAADAPANSMTCDALGYVRDGLFSVRA